MSLAIPDPATVDLDRARDLAAAVVAWAEECDDLAALEDARAKVAAIETSLRRRGEAVAAEIATADRKLEMRIAAVHGPAQVGGDRKSPQIKSRASDLIPKQRLHEFRKMLDHEDVPEVADAINNGASRREVLRRIDQHHLDAELAEQDEWAANLPKPTDPQGDRHRAAVRGALMGAADAARTLAKYTPTDVQQALDSEPYRHVAEQAAADLIEAVTTLANYQETAERWT